MRTNKKWWEKRWYWALSLLVSILLIPILIFFLFSEVPLSAVLFNIIGLSLGFILAYVALSGRLGKKRFEVRTVRTLRRIAFIMGGATLGLFTWAFVVSPLGFYFNIDPKIVFFSMFVLMVIGALIMDTIGKRRDYSPFL